MKSVYMQYTNRQKVNTIGTLGAGPKLVCTGVSKLLALGDKNSFQFNNLPRIHQPKYFEIC